MLEDVPVIVEKVLNVLAKATGCHLFAAGCWDDPNFGTKCFRYVKSTYDLKSS